MAFHSDDMVCIELIFVCMNQGRECSRQKERDAASIRFLQLSTNHSPLFNFEFDGEIT